MDDMLWRRVREGRSAAIVGGGLPAQVPDDVVVLRVFCDEFEGPMAPVLELERQASRWSSERPGWVQAGEWLAHGVRRRLLGEADAGGRRQAIAQTFSHLAREVGRPCALVFEAVEAADPATLTFLAEVLRRPGWLRVPLVLGFRDAAPAGRAASLLELLDGGVFRARSASDAPDAAPLPTGIPGDVLRVLRACALAGPGFDVHLVAELLGVSAVAVLEALQRAVDHGVPLADAGDGRLRLPPPVAAELERSLLPSLATAWHRRLAELLSVDPPEHRGGWKPPLQGPDPGLSPEPGTSEIGGGWKPPLQGPDPELSPEPGTSEIGGGWKPPLQGADPEPSPEPGTSEIGGGWKPPLQGADPELSPSPTPTPAPSPTPSPSSSEIGGGWQPPLQGPSPSPNPARAASHWASAGDPDRAAGRLLLAAHQAADLGAFPEAFDYVQRAEAVVADLPASPARRAFRAGVQIETARLQWLASGADRGFTLADALATLDATRDAADAALPTVLRAELRALSAWVLYDIGDDASLARALDELTDATRLLQRVDRPLDAARLLNDQAAVWVRLGDPVRAHRLLQQSRAAFEARVRTSPEAAEELAETDHLLARLVLHVAKRPGREADAVDRALDHAVAAARAYDRLGNARQRARVDETLGRLELERARPAEALPHLERAARAQERHGDLLGLARTADAFAQAMARLGRPRDALQLVSQSIAFNLEKGSAVGLAYNRRCLERLASDLPAEHRALLAPDLRALLARLSAGEERLGQATLHGKAGA